MKQPHRIISLALSISVIIILIILISCSVQVNATRPINHRLSLTSFTKLNMARAYSGPSKRGIGHK
ncbi:hypothetical protein Pint_08704 [Pistacia integerrima]|uniref:Uncharacterized protein n=2 Tax=Pistacia TaxID=55512 RepID=A0ACC1ADG9_9ROSI|nr:hypothetical protein Pint_08704 [Pistacia integerrima]KAJ0085580.1 hypothetical protein Patl1_08877 [Pistacia atlantica]